MNRQTYFTKLNESYPFDNRFNELEIYANANNVPIMQHEGINFMKHLIKMANVKTILEIGTAIAYSAINFALVNENIFITTIERDQLMYNEAIKNISKFNLENRIKVIFADALDLDLSILESNFDLLFVDAAKGQYQKFFEKYTPLLKNKGLVVSDNLLFHDLIFNDNIKNRNTKQLVNKIRNYNEYLKANKQFSTYFYPLGDGIAVSIKES